MKILVAHESPRLLDRIICLISELKGVEIIGHTGDWPATLQATRRLLPDVVIMNVQLIRGRRIDALRDIKAENPLSTLIVLTTLDDAPYRRRCLDAGVDFCLDGSTEVGRLGEIIHGLHRRFGMGSKALP